jgi:threonine dehydratase
MRENTIQKADHPTLEGIYAANKNLEGVVTHTPLMPNLNLSDNFNAEILLKREDLQLVRSYKLRGAYNKISSLPKDQVSGGIVCASAGNHAQGVAYSCYKLNIKGTIFMPSPTPQQKVTQVKMFGKEMIDVMLCGDTFDDSYQEAMAFGNAHNLAFIHPFDDLKVIEGQGTVGLEILEDSTSDIDYVFLPIGGGGLASGLSTVFKQLSPHTKIIGVEPAGAPSMQRSMEEGKVVTLPRIDKFVDGAAVKQVGALTFDICRNLLDEVISVPEGKVCSTILKLYNEEAIVVEPAGALSIAALDQYRNKIKGKKVVCVVSGSNNDITRTEEIRERSLLYEGLKHYFIVRFPQRSGALREFLNEVLGPGDDITHFEYRKKHNRERGPAVVGLELKNKEDFQGLLDRMDKKKIAYQYLNDQQDLFQYLAM